MSKAYSTKALPAGTILREWRLEEVLGVGGFGIVYKGRGIYFDELVAIKEYFPSSISERDEDDTVVPVDSSAEEVHALGLKKFVEEAKLLWNLSTPSRHPNIVSVRSLFEIHGTAYMVMDFEDGTALSRLLKQGKKFNEASLSKIILPIAEGLERAHRVGVLHRDIKPPNIMVGEDDRAVLIDFGSARFESGEATSTKVTFHTPPYAPIEQYVRTYEQGPWTDIYALGVVLYECVTGEKPPEVLERLHGGLGKPMAEGHYPGFSQSFLHAIDAAMTIRPDERPQSIAAWLEMFNPGGAKPAAPVLVADDDDDDDVTRIATFDTTSEKIVPVAPVANGFSSDGKLDTGVPDTPSRADFRKGEDEKEEAQPKSTPAIVTGALAAGAIADTALAKNVSETPVEIEKGSTPDVPNKKDVSGKPPEKAGSSRFGMPVVVGIGILGLVGAIVFFATSGGGDLPNAPVAMASEAIAVPAQADDYPAMFAALTEEAQKAGIGGDALALLSVEDALPGDEAAAVAKLQEFGAATLDAGEAKARKLGRDLPWASVTRNGAKGETPVRQKLASDITAAYKNLQSRAGAVSKASALEDSLGAVRDEISAFSTFNVLTAASYRNKDRTPVEAASPTATETTTIAAPSEAPSQAAPEADTGVTSETKRNFASVISDARDLARQIERLASRNKPGSNASDEEKEGYRTRQASAEAAARYGDYLNTLEASMRGTTSEAEARNSVVKASQTRAYLQALLNRSKVAK